MLIPRSTTKINYKNILSIIFLFCFKGIYKLENLISGNFEFFQIWIFFFYIKCFCFIFFKLCCVSLHKKNSKKKTFFLQIWLTALIRSMEGEYCCNRSTNRLKHGSLWLKLLEIAKNSHKTPINLQFLWKHIWIFFKDQNKCFSGVQYLVVILNFW